MTSQHSNPARSKRPVQLTFHHGIHPSVPSDETPAHPLSATVQSPPPHTLKAQPKMYAVLPPTSRQLKEAGENPKRTHLNHSHHAHPSSDLPNLDNESQRALRMSVRERV
jgi:hypothetical protein